MSQKIRPQNPPKLRFFRRRRSFGVVAHVTFGPFFQIKSGRANPGPVHMCSRPISHVTQLSGSSQARTSAYQRIPAHSTIMGVSTKRPPHPAGLNYAAIFGIGTPALRRSGTVGGAVAPSVPLPGVPLRHVAAVLLLSIGLVAATMLLFHMFPVLVGLLYIGPDGAPECTADPSVVSAASPPAVSYACSCIALV